MKILITGGTGFLGKRLGIKLSALGHDVVLTGRNNKSNLLAASYTSCHTLAMDVSSIESVRDIVNQVRPEAIIHAAATKFVDISERQPMEAIDTNVVGSQNVARVAVDRGVGLVIGISTDKASPPVRSTYGLTKAIMERLFCAMDDKAGTRFLCVRYGNVAWSTGSVLCIWRRMLKDSGVIGTTGPEMIRYFFTVDEAVLLVVTALEHACELRGAVLAREMRSARMEDILRVWTELEHATYERIEGRPGERSEEFLVGGLEVPYTEPVSYGGIQHYAIRFNARAGTPIHGHLSSGNAPRLTREEIIRLIQDPPVEER